MLEDLPPLPRCVFAVAKGNTTVSTKEAFEILDGHGKRQIKSSDDITEMINKGNINGVCAGLYNAFEINGKCDDNIKRIMMKNNAYNALMSGSGPSVFGIFKDEADANSAAKELKAENYECFVCTPEENRP